MSGRSVNLTTLFLGRLRPPKRLTSTKTSTGTNLTYEVCHSDLNNVKTSNDCLLTSHEHLITPPHCAYAFVRCARVSACLCVFWMSVSVY